MARTPLYLPPFSAGCKLASEILAEFSPRAACPLLWFTNVAPRQGAFQNRALVPRADSNTERWRGGWNYSEHIAVLRIHTTVYVHRLENCKAGSADVRVLGVRLRFFVRPWDFMFGC